VNKISTEYPAFYRILEVDPAASEEVIHAAYRACVKQLDPRLLGEDGDRARLYNEAHSVLTNPPKRKEYDRSARFDGQAIVGNYIIEKLLAEGGFGPTYLGRHRISNMPVCIKHCHEVSAASKQILLDEARAIWDLRHYALPVMRDILEMEDGSLAIVMSFIPGPTIEQVVRVPPA
jgi:curved DNA-binding protein CbpA